MVTQPHQANPAYRTKVVSIETVGRDGHPLARPIVVFPTGVGPSKNYGGRFAYDADKVAQFKAGDEVYLEIARGDLKKGITDPKWDTDYYWNIVRLEPYTNQQPPAGRPAPQQPELPTHPAARAPEVLRGSAPTPQAPKPPPHPASATTKAVEPMPMHDPDATEKRREDATNRRTALMQAVAALPHIKAANPSDSIESLVGKLAQSFYETLLTLHAPEREAE